MTRQELTEKTVAELTAICKEKGLTCYNDKKKLTKVEMIEKILVSDDVQESMVEGEKSSYVETAQLGTLVAFREPKTNKLNTAKVVKKSTKNRKLKLQTQYGAEFVVSYEDVVWVKTGTRWPRGIYNELKGIKSDENR